MAVESDDRDNQFLIGLTVLSQNNMELSINSILEYLDVTVMSADAIVFTIIVCKHCDRDLMAYWEDFFKKCVLEVQNRGMDTSYLYRLMES